jgi:hypothetical protein
LNANVNYIQQDTFFCPIKRKHLLSYNADGSEKLNFNENQPTTPLKMCVFRFSDHELNEHDRSVIIEIAKLLIKFGASTINAKECYESRYLTPIIEKELWYTFYKLLCE